MTDLGFERPEMLPVARGFDSSYGPWLGDWDQYRHTIIGQHPYSGIHPRGGVGLLEDENPDGERPPKHILTLQISAQEALTSAEILSVRRRYPQQPDAHDRLPVPRDRRRLHQRPRSASDRAAIQQPYS